ncbi:hypothetical protein HAX54_034172 [Datura stramonium]|uniref:Uncharacterized protein n=1 Tax=Datura stramonium TaxID=4076 RepID=A0ABS8RM49_DATST|nr:hypothetical protein [Datura stramonium]
MDTYDDIFYELEQLFDGDKCDHRKISTDQIHKDDDKQSIPLIDQDEQKEVVPDAQKIAIEESDKEVKKEIQKSEINLIDSKINDEVIKKRREVSAIESTNDPLVARRTNPKRAHRSATDPPEELIRGN